MHFLAAHALSRAAAGQRAVRFPMLERLPVIVGESHLPLQHLAHQPGDRGILLGGFSACPQSRLIRDSDRYIPCHESSVARKQCAPENNGTSHIRMSGGSDRRSSNSTAIPPAFFGFVPEKKCR